MSTSDQPESQENDAATAVTEHTNPLTGDESSESFEFVEAPTFALEHKGDCAYEAKISIPPANKKKKMEEMLAEVQEEVALPGFRRGKAPRKLIENKFAKALRGDVFQELVSAAVEKLLKENDLQPYTTPDFEGIEEAIEQEDDAAIEIVTKFEVFPRVELGDFQGAEIERPFIVVNEQDVDNAIAEMLERHAAFETVAEGEAAAEGDQVIIDFSGEIDGEAFEGGAAENYPYILGSGYFFAEFEEALKGVKQNAEVKCHVDFPEDYGNKALAGKKADFTIKVNEIKRKSAPALDQEFVADLGFDSVEAYKAKVKGDLEEGAKNQSTAIVEDRAIAAAVAASTFEIPKSIIDNMTGEYVEQERRRLAAMRVPVSEWEAREAEFTENARQAAERDIKALVTLHEIAKQNKLEVTDEDFAEEAEAIQARTGADMSVVKRFLAKGEQRSEYAERIIKRKAVAHILAGAKIVDKEITAEDMEELEENRDEDA